jgi:hypothetical protein
VRRDAVDHDRLGRGGVHAVRHRDEGGGLHQHVAGPGADLRDGREPVAQKRTVDIVPRFRTIRWELTTAAEQSAGSGRRSAEPEPWVR